MQIVQAFKLESQSNKGNTISYDPNNSRPVRLDTPDSFVVFRNVEEAVKQVEEFLEGLKQLEELVSNG